MILNRWARFSVLFAMALACPASAATLQQAVARYEAWRGGAAFRRLDVLHEVGKASTGALSGTVEVWMAPGRTRQDVDLGVFRQSTAVGGETDWTINLSRQVKPVSPAERADALEAAAVLLAAPFHGVHGATVVAAPQEVRAGARWDVVRVTYPGGGEYDYFISPDSGALMGVRIRSNGQVRFTRYDDWRRVGGVRLPFAELTEGETATDSSDVRYASIEVDKRFPDILLQRPRASSHARFLGGAPGSGWLPFEFVGGNRIFVDAEINGRKVQAVLDSGAEASALDRRFADQLGLVSRGAVTAQGTGGADTASLVSGVGVRLGQLTLSDLTVASIDLSRIEAAIGHPLPMVLGAEVFQDCVVEIDFVGRRIAFHDPAAFRPSPEAVVAALTTANGIYTLKAEVDGREVALDFDLGNGSPLLLTPGLWRQPGFMEGRPTSTTLSGAIGGSHVARRAMVRELRIGGASFHQVPATLIGTESAGARSDRSMGNVGLPVLSRFRLIVDIPHSRVLFAPPADASTPFRVDHSGLALAVSDGGLKVEHVAKGSPAEGAGIKAGDVITAVDGAPPPASLEAAKAWTYQPPGVRVRLRLKDDAEKELTLAAYY